MKITHPYKNFGLTSFSRFSYLYTNVICDDERSVASNANTKIQYLSFFARTQNFICTHLCLTPEEIFHANGERAHKIALVDVVRCHRKNKLPVQKKYSDKKNKTFRYLSLKKNCLFRGRQPETWFSTFLRET